MPGTNTLEIVFQTEKESQNLGIAYSNDMKRILVEKLSWVYLCALFLHYILLYQIEIVIQNEEVGQMIVCHISAEDPTTFMEYHVPRD